MYCRQYIFSMCADRNTGCARAAPNFAPAIFDSMRWMLSAGWLVFGAQDELKVLSGISEPTFRYQAGDRYTVSQAHVQKLARHSATAPSHLRDLFIIEAPLRACPF